MVRVYKKYIGAALLLALCLGLAAFLGSTLYQPNTAQNYLARLSSRYGIAVPETYEVIAYERENGDSLGKNGGILKISLDADYEGDTTTVTGEELEKIIEVDLPLLTCETTALTNLSPDQSYAYQIVTIDDGYSRLHVWYDAEQGTLTLMEILI